jgi:hypothetical protein
MREETELTTKKSGDKLASDNLFYGKLGPSNRFVSNTGSSVLSCEPDWVYLRST